MKSLLKNVSMLMLSSIVFFSACKEDDPVKKPTETTAEIIQGELTGTTSLDASKKYLLRGKVYVQAGAELNIPAGTLVMGEKSTDGTLIINRGGKLNAMGTASNPVIFTSEAPKGFRNRGDWGGIVICGNATTNGNASSTIEGITGQAGSENGVYGPGAGAAQTTQSSGTLTYCRIEFAGIDLSQDNELNSLTMGAVGSGTIINNIMVSYANDDAYEWFGGTNNMKYILAYSTLDDDFDTDRGFSGMVQYGLIIRQKGQADISTSRAFESSSNNNATATPHTTAKFANITVMGPRLFGSSISTLYGAAVEVNSNSNLEVRNSVITGFPIGVRYNTSGPDAKILNNIFAENATLNAVSGGSVLPTTFDVDNMIYATKDEIWGSGAALNDYPVGVILPAATSPYNTGAPDLSGAGFESNAFYGAFPATPQAGWSWNSGWINFDPINTDY